MITRKRMLNAFDAARDLAPYAEVPVMPAHIDPQVHLSRNDRAQPFYLICSKDTVLAQMSGAARVDLRHSNVLYQELEPGDMIYVPAGTAHRIVPHEVSIHLRYKALAPGLEAVAWFCADCDAEVWRHEFDAAAEPAQAGYQAGCEAYNADEERRRCTACGTVQPAVDLTGYDWVRIAKELAAE